MIAECVSDFAPGWLLFFKADSAEDKRKHIQESTLPLIAKFAPRLERIVAMNAANSGTPYSVGNSLTYADIVLADCCTSYSELLDGEYNEGSAGKGWLNEYPALEAVTQLVCALPGVKEYLQSSKRFPFPGGEVGAAYKANVWEVLARN